MAKSETPAGGDYRPRKHINAVLAASGATYGPWAVLEAMCRLSEFARPEVTCTKADLMREARRSINTVKLALQELKAEGTIKPVRNTLGGRGNAVTWRLCVSPAGAKRAAQAAPEPGDEAPEAGNLWDRVRTLYKAADASTYSAWLKDLQFSSAEGGELRLVAASTFVAGYCQTHLSDQILRIAANLEPEIVKVKVGAA